MEGEHSRSIAVSGIGSHSTSRDNNGTLSILYSNPRSLVPKLDELSAVIEAHNPDIVSIVESWLCADISDSELHIPRYQLFRKDCHRHGGGVLLYIKSNFTVTVLPSHQTNLEILPIVIHLSNISFLYYSF